MNRLVYSPSYEYKIEAEELAVSTGLPVLYGENEHTKNLSFNRNKVQILFIPKEKFLGFPKTVNKMFACPIGYENDWLDMDSTIECWAFLDDKKIKANISFIETHFVRYIVRFPFIGNWKIEILQNGKVLDEGEIQVVS